MKPETEAARRARYAARDVTAKLGIKPGGRVLALGRADPALLAKVRAKTGRRVAKRQIRPELVLYWPRVAAEITATLTTLKRQIEPAGGIWVVSAKRGHEAFSRSPYLPDAPLIAAGLAAGLVDNKVCSLSDHESAMRFVIRRSDRR